MGVRAISGALLALAAGTPAWAQDAPANGTQFRDWTLACRAVGVGQTACVLNQVLVQAADNAFLAEIGISLQPPAEGGDDPRAVLVLRVPTGVLLLRRPGLRVDEDAGVSVPMQWQACDADFCTASAVLTPEQTVRLRGGLAGVMGYQRLDAREPTIFDVSLLGITAGMQVLEDALPGAGEGEGGDDS